MSDLLSVIPDDGYNDEAYVAEQHGLHGAHRIKYRPMTHQDRYVIGTALANKTPAQASQLIAATVAKHVKQWDVRGATGETLPIDAANCCRLKPNLLERFYGIVSGRDGGDPDQERTPKNDALEAELQAILEDRPVGAVREENDVKN